jgi:hypothetical protein
VGLGGVQDGVDGGQVRRPGPADRPDGPATGSGDPEAGARGGRGLQPFPPPAVLPRQRPDDFPDPPLPFPEEDAVGQRVAVLPDDGLRGHGVGAAQEDDRVIFPAFSGEEGNPGAEQEVGEIEQFQDVRVGDQYQVKIPRRATGADARQRVPGILCPARGEEGHVHVRPGQGPVDLVEEKRCGRERSTSRRGERRTMSTRYGASSNRGMSQVARSMSQGALGGEACLAPAYVAGYRIGRFSGGGEAAAGKTFTSRTVPAGRRGRIWGG